MRKIVASFAASLDGYIEDALGRVSLDLIKHQVFRNGSVAFTYNVRK